VGGSGGAARRRAGVPPAGARGAGRRVQSESDRDGDRRGVDFESPPGGGPWQRVAAIEGGGSAPGLGGERVAGGDARQGDAGRTSGEGGVAADGPGGRRIAPGSGAGIGHTRPHWIRLIAVMQLGVITTAERGFAPVLPAPCYH